MLDPYLVLGVDKYDDDQTVKKAYRQLSKQYHPDNNINNPNKEAAEETFKKIQQAYEQAMHERSLGIGGPNDSRRFNSSRSERSETGSYDRSENNNSAQSRDSGYSQSGSNRYSQSSGNTGYSQNGSNGYSQSSGNTGYTQGGNAGYSQSSGNTGYSQGGSTGYSQGGNSGYSQNGSNTYSQNGNTGYYNSRGNNSYTSGGNNGYSQNGYNGYGYSDNERNDFSRGWNDGYDQSRNTAGSRDNNQYGQWGSTRTKEKERNQFFNRNPYSTGGGYYTGNSRNYSYNNNQNSYQGNNTNTANSGTGYYTGGNNQGYYGTSSGSFAGENENFNNNINNDTYGNMNNYSSMDERTALDTAMGFINDRNFFSALDVLSTIKNRNDVWYYYSAIANLALGNNITAMNHARTAKAMNPNMAEYDELINGMESGTLQYRGRSNSFVPQKANKGNICVKLIIANVALNVFCGGGGLCVSGTCRTC